MTRRAAMTKRPGWTRLSPPGRKLDALWVHDASGWRVRHCGHPTALHPYYAESPHLAPMVVSQSGQAFDTLLDAATGVESVINRKAELVELHSDRFGPILAVRAMPAGQATPVHELYVEID